MPDGRNRLLFDVLAICGVRIGEAFALTRASVDLLHGRLVVAIATTEAEGLAIKDTKSHSVRRIALPAFLLAALREHLATVPADPDAVLWPSRTGRPMRYGSYRRWVWDPAAVEAGLAEPKPTPVGQAPERPGKPGPKPKPALHDQWTVMVTPHSLRATHPSVVAAEHGVLEAARRLGHSSSSVTSSHYARPLAGGDDTVAAWLDRLRLSADEGGK
jgi:integrase